MLVTNASRRDQEKAMKQQTSAVSHGLGGDGQSQPPSKINAREWHRHPLLGKARLPSFVEEKNNAKIIFKSKTSSKITKDEAQKGKKDHRLHDSLTLFKLCMKLNGLGKNSG